MPKQKLTDSFIRYHKKPDKRIEYFDTVMGGLVLRITPTGHKSFCYRYGPRGKKYTIGEFPTIGLAEARSKVKDLKSTWGDGKDPQEEKRARRNKPAPVTVKNLAERFTGQHLPTLRESTQKSYRNRIDTEILPVFGNTPIDSINIRREDLRKDLIEFFENIALRRGEHVQANRVRAIFSSMFSFGMKKAMIDYNPVQTIEPVGEETSRDRVYNDDEIYKLWDAFQLQPEPVRSVYKMLLCCGQRSGETKTMSWNAVSLNEKIWTIEADETKPDRKHYVPLPPIAIEILERLHPLTGENKYVFESPKFKDQPVRWIHDAKKRIREQSGVQDFRPHDLRRTVSSNLARLGIGRTVNGKVLNHKGLAGDNRVTAIYDRYEYMEEKRDALNRWNQLLLNILDGNKKEATVYKIGS